MKKKKADKSIKYAATTRAAATAVPERHAGMPLSMLTLAFLIIVALATAAYMRNSIYHDFLTLWGDITKTSPNKRRAHENYGQALSTVGRLDEAMREFNTVLALKDDGSVPMRDLYREIGVVFFRMNRMNDAISSWETGLRHAPNDASLLNNLSIALMQTNRYEEAAAHARTALISDPNMPQALNTMGQVSMLKRDYAGAVNYFLRAIEQQPDVPARYWNAALALDQAGKYEQSLKYAQIYVEQEQDPAAVQRANGLIEHLKKMIGR